MNSQRNKQGILRLWVVQFCFLVAYSVLYGLFLSGNAAKSALLGGLVYLIPNAYFAIKLFKYQGARAARQIVNSFYKGEALKIGLSVFLFTAVFIWCKITPLAFFSSYVLVLMTHWFAPWIIVNKQNRPKSD